SVVYFRCLSYIFRTQTFSDIVRYPRLSYVRITGLSLGQCSSKIFWTRIYSDLDIVQYLSFVL
ncbi:9767_t:CDS:1, partial [Dentiscutata heterogama]